MFIGTIYIVKEYFLSYKNYGTFKYSGIPLTQAFNKTKTVWIPLLSSPILIAEILRNLTDF